LKTLVTNIGQLVNTGDTVGQLHISTDQAFVIEDGFIGWVGDITNAPKTETIIDAKGRVCIPGFVDSHSHLIFAGARHQEFSHRMAGESYQAGGIKSTVSATRGATDQELRENAAKLVAELHASGITHFEIKSGYGLDLETEIRSLAIASEFTEDVTFLGAHVVPEGVARADYLSLVTGPMLDQATGLAKWIDVFCDDGAFTVEESRMVLEAGIAKGLRPRMHSNQLKNIGGIALAVELDCASVDHCTDLSQADIDLLAQSSTVATFVPGAEFSTRASYPDVRPVIAAGVTVAIATDCNPGSSFTTSMPFCIAVAVRELYFSVDQALWAATKGGARALENELGSLAVGSRADFALLDAKSYIDLAYRPGVPIVSATYVAGQKVFERTSN
jgi:imidazolonepropionase